MLLIVFSVVMIMLSKSISELIDRASTLEQWTLRSVEGPKDSTEHDPATGTDRYKPYRPISPVLMEVGKLKHELSDVKDMTVGLRQAINPDKPEEILTLARLSDKITRIAENFENLQKTQTEKYLIFTDGIKREVDSVRNTRTVILVALASIVVGVAYSIFKPRRPREGENVS